MSRWSRRYPVLLDCVAYGRSPTDRDVEIVAARMRRELGIAEQGAPARITARVMMAARLALEGVKRERASARGPERA